MNAAAKIYGERSITLTRHIKAPRALVWKAWTDKEMLRQWWGPEMFSNPVVEGDVAVGKTLAITMHGPKDTPFDRDFPMTKHYVEIVPNEKLVFDNSAIGPDGEILIKGFTTVTFQDEADGTRLTIETSGKAMAEVAIAMIGGMDQGWSGSLNKLEKLVSR
jgi:uncharacterized protein YndB with AHSA1/START domain